MSRRIEGRSVLVTGGTGHLGPHVVRRLLEEGAGVHVPVRREARGKALARFVGEGADALHLHAGGDLAGPAAAEALVRAVRDTAGGGPDALVHLAGGFAVAPVEATDPATWEELWRANASTAFLCARAVFPAMKEAGRGRIVTVSAHPALERGAPGLAAYAAAKAAVLNLTGTLAREGAAHGITANSVLPSVIDTPGNRRAMPQADPSTWIHPRDIGAVIAFLLSDEARTVTGAALTLSLG